MHTETENLPFHHQAHRTRMTRHWKSLPIDGKPQHCYTKQNPDVIIWYQQKSVKTICLSIKVLKCTRRDYTNHCGSIPLLIQSPIQ